MAPRGMVDIKKILAERKAVINKRKHECYKMGSNKRPCLPVEDSFKDAKSADQDKRGPKYADLDKRALFEDDLSGTQEEATLEEGLLTVSLLKHQRMALAWMEKRERPSSNFHMGGILADDQGLGKTISTIALILKNRSPKFAGDTARGGTLVVCPTSVLRQWATELKTKTSEDAGLTILVYHGNRKKDAQNLATYDVVLTTYAIVANENPTPKSWKEDGLGYDGDYLDIENWRNGQARAQNRVQKNPIQRKKKLPGPLSEIKWYRVVLDEAQCIRTASTITARAVWGLDTQRRWCLSGTPLQNQIGDLYSYLRFLQYHPYELYVEFHNNIKRYIDDIRQKKKRYIDVDENMQNLETKTEAYKLVGRIFKDILLRRTKTTMIGNQPILNLPPRIVNLEEVEFTPGEADFYAKLEHEIKGRIEKFVKSGKELMSRFLILMVYLLRMRQACNHSSLVINWKTKEFDEDIEEDSGRALCEICHDLANEMATTSCSHVCCQSCVNLDEGVCPICGKALLEAQDSVPDSEKKWVSSSKIDAVIKKLQAIPKGEKALVFSQWTSMLDLLEQPLKTAGIHFSRLDGTMSVVARDRAIHDFNTNAQVCVILMSLKATSLGINMVAASHVLLVDVWWNPTVEDQAIDRAHRIGQTRPVMVTRFHMKDSVETRVLGIQDKKKEMVRLAFGEVSVDDMKLNKLTEQDFRTLLNIKHVRS